MTESHGTSHTVLLAELVPRGGLGLLHFLRYAVALADAVAERHDRGELLPALTPEQLSIDRATGRVTVLSPAAGAVSPTADPRYLSPEASGRLGLSPDRRSDLYTLGIILYELLTGGTPYSSDDLLELVHSHLTRPPVPPAVARESIPAVLSALVMKLIAKDPAERYQSAVGLRYDLDLCLRQFERSGVITGIVLGRGDHPGTLHFPRRLYGREEEYAALAGSFSRVAHGAREIALVSGYSGVGKSSLVHELRQPVLSRHGWFISGKFEQYRLATPYSALADAFTQLVRRLLGERADYLARWREVLTGQVGPNLRIVADIIPAMEQVVGDLPPIPALPPLEAENRLLFTFGALIRAVATAAHPLALFVDDLQWADQASLRLLRHLACDRSLSHLLLIGAFRDNELSPAHPLVSTLDEITAGGGIVSRIVLLPLDEEATSRLVTDTLHAPDEAGPLVQLVLQKTDGNPFFVRQFLQALCDRGLLRFDRDAGGWEWDLRAIRAEGFTDNVIDLLTGKIGRLPLETRDILKHAACIGGSFDPATLGTVMECDAASLVRFLTAAVAERLISGGDPASSTTPYYFLHDRVRQAAYSLLSDEERCALHLKIGRRLLADVSNSGRILETVNHLNAGTPLLHDPVERELLSRLNLEAGRAVRSEAAHGAAGEYFAAGSALLGSDCWSARYELAFPLHLERAECACLTADFKESRRLYDLALVHARTRLDKAEVYQGLLALHEMTGDARQAVRCGLMALEELGHPLGPLPVRMLMLQKLLAISLRMLRREIEEIERLPTVTDREIMAAQNILILLVPPAYFISKDLVVTLALHMVELSLRYGNAPGSHYAYVTFGVVMGSVLGNYRSGKRWGDLAMTLCTGEGESLLANRTRLIFGGYINHWTRSVRSSISLLRETCRKSLEAGDIRTAIHTGAVLGALLFESGESLETVQGEAAKQAALCRDAGYREQEGTHRALQRLVLNLRGETDGRATFNGAGYDEERDMQEMRSADIQVSLTVYLYLKICSLYLFGYHEQSYRMALDAERIIADKQFGSMTEADFRLYLTLAAIASYPGLTSLEQYRCRRSIRANLKKLGQWSRFCPENFRHKQLLVEAELCRINLSPLAALPLYEQAIAGAREQGFLQYEALGNELAGRFCRANGDDVAGGRYLREGRECYLRWGATGKARALAEEHPVLFGLIPDSFPSPPSSPPARGTAIDPDMLSMVRASQAISEAPDLERLLKTLLRIVIQHAGAQRGVVIMEASGALQVVAEGSSDSQEIIVNEGGVRESGAAFPAAMVNLAVHTGEIIIVNDAAEPCEFPDDPYLANGRPHSMMCLPLGHQGRRASAIYLENRLLPHAFTSERIAVLNLLAHQIAVSLENALLNREKEEILRYLHDSISSDLVTIRFAGEVLNPQAERDELAAKLAVITDIAKNSIETIRTFMNLAAGETLSLREFTGMLSDCVYRIFDDTPVDFELVEQGDSDMMLSPLTAFNLHLICKEAMTNIRKHAAADHVVLTIDAVAGGLTISLCDDGRGFDVSARHTGGHGVGNMAARAEKLGATFTISSDPGSGTEIRLHLPPA